MSASKGLMQAAAGVETANPWNVSTAQWLPENLNYFYVGNQETSPQQFFFKPDGTKVYIVGVNQDKVHEYDLSTAWKVSSASLLQSLDVNPQESLPTALFFKPDGTKMYLLGATGDDVNEYDLSTAWDISSASHLQTFSVSAQETDPQGLFFKPDGLKMYVAGFDDEVNEYDLSTAWDVSSASHLQSFDVSSQETLLQGLFFKPDGTKMYIIGSNGDEVNEYDLSTAWDVSSASHLQSFDVSDEDGSPQGLFFKSDGTEMYVMGNAKETIFQYQLSTAWDISSASYQEPTTRYFDGSAIDPNIADIFFKPDGSKMYLVGLTGEDINEFDVSNPWDISSASLSHVLSVSAQDANPDGIFFKPDGTRMYVTGLDGDDVNEYDLSTAWDISSASFSRTKSVSAQETAPRGVFFKPDGTRMYITGSGSDAVHEYTVNPAWAVTAASFSQTFSVSAQESNPQSIFFKPDGLKMYIVGSTGDEVNEYDLSTAWDISSATFLHNFDVSNQDSLPTGIFFKPDGLRMYITGAFTDSVYEYDL